MEKTREPKNDVCLKEGKMKKTMMLAAFMTVFMGVATAHADYSWVYYDTANYLAQHTGYYANKNTTQIYNVLGGLQSSTNVDAGVTNNTGNSTLGLSSLASGETLADGAKAIAYANATIALGDSLGAEDVQQLVNSSVTRVLIVNGGGYYDLNASALGYDSIAFTPIHTATATAQLNTTALVSLHNFDSDAIYQISLDDMRGEGGAFSLKNIYLDAGSYELTVNCNTVLEFDNIVNVGVSGLSLGDSIDGTYLAGTLISPLQITGTISVSSPTPPVATPIPGTLFLLLPGMLSIALRVRKAR